MSEFGLNSDHESDGEDDVMTPAEVLQKLEDAWLNEKFAPDLLEHKAEVVDCIMEQIQEMEDNIQRAKKGDFKVSIHKMEIDRIRFVLSSYLRTRLKKIEKNVTYLLETADPEKPKMSQEELAFAKEYRDNLENHMKSLAVRHMPQNLQTLEAKHLGVKPYVDGYVFLRVNDNVEGVLVEEETMESREEVVDLEKGDQHIMRYQPVSSLLGDGAISLI